MHLLKSAATLLALASLSAAPIRAIAPTASHDFHVEDRWEIGGKGGWGYLALDPVTHHLLIARTDHISALDTSTGRVVGEIDGMSNIRNIALDDSGKYGYATDVTDGTAGFVRVFDRSDYRLVTSIPTGPIPYAIVFDSATKHIFAFSSREHNVGVIDPATSQTVSTIPLDGRPANAVDDGKGSVYVALPAQGEIQRINAVTKKVTASWPISPCTGPANLAIDGTGRQLFTTCEDHKLVVVSTTDGHVTSVVDAPENAGGLDFDPHTNTLFLADPTGLLAIFRRDKADRYTLLQNVKTEPGARTLAVSNKGGKAYLVTAKFGINNSPNVSEELRYRPTPITGTFSVIVVAR